MHHSQRNDLLRFARFQEIVFAYSMQLLQIERPLNRIAPIRLPHRTHCVVPAQICGGAACKCNSAFIFFSFLLLERPLQVLARLACKDILHRFRTRRNAKGFLMHGKVLGL
jgi:hypothetical protein